jgi:hypothetical protein
VKPIEVPFEGVEAIPSLEAVRDADGDTVFYRLEGNCPIVVVAPHAGTPGSTPPGVTVFGERVDDPATERVPTFTDDSNTLPITFAVVRTLCAMGLVPYAVINQVSRRYMDLNRRWQSQEMWVDPAGSYRPGDETKSATEFPRVAEFTRFKETYYDLLHDAVRGFTTAIHPTGWLFDIHGRGVEGADLVLFTGYGHYARRDLVYDAGPVALHAHLTRQGFALDPDTPDPGAEVVDTTGAPTSNLMSGDRYGASVFDGGADPIPRPDIVVPSQSHRVHGVQFEFARSLRDGPPEEMEGVGIRLAYGIAGFLLDNGVIARTADPASGVSSLVWFSQMG